MTTTPSLRSAASPAAGRPTAEPATGPTAVAPAPRLRVAFLTLYDASTASSRIRAYQFAPALALHGIDVTFFPLLTGDTKRWLTRLAAARNPLALFRALSPLAVRAPLRALQVIRSWSFDAVLVQKDVLPLGLASLLFLGQKRVIFDFDDPIWLPNPSAGGKLSAGRFLTRYRMRLLDAMIARSRVVLVDNELLRNHAKRLTRDCRVVCSPIDTRAYAPRGPLTGTEKVLGWIGSPATAYLLHAMLPALERLAARFPLRLLNVGGPELKSKHFAIENIAWSEDAERAALSRMHAGLAPSDESPFNLHRFNYKVVIYFAGGVPPLAAGVGLNREMVADGVNGVLYDPHNTDDLMEKAARMLTDTRWNEALSKAARAEAERTYDVRVLAGTLVEAIRSARGGVE